MPNHREDSVSLIVYLDERFRAHDALHEEQSRAVVSAMDQVNQRLAQMTEFRNTLETMRSAMVDRNYYESRHVDIDKRLQTLERQSATKAALESQNTEVQRMRRNLFYTVIGGVILILADIILAAFKR